MVLNGIYFSKDLITKIYFLISLAEQNSTERMVNVSPLKHQWTQKIWSKPSFISIFMTVFHDLSLRTFETLQ